MSAEETNPVGSSSSAPLHKGRACMNCRRRKIKCDGVKPQCGPCASSSGSFRDCEYSDQGFTPTQLLEERIAVLEARIQELEHPDQSTGSLTLHNPYRESDSLPSQANPPALTLTNTPPSRYRVSESLSEPLPDEVRDILIHNFLPHSLELGFFLDPIHFRISVLEGTDDVSPALLNAVYLLGCHLSNSPEIRAQEPTLVSRTQIALSGPPLQAVLQWVQAEVLMSQYLFGKARILEAKYHATAAVSLVYGAGLHNTHAQIQPSSHSPVLRPPANAIEQGERINAFWTVLILHTCWVVSDGCPNIPFDAPDSRIDVPWPLNLSQYPQSPLPVGSHSIRNFLAGHRDGASSVLALHAKAAIMYEQSAQLPRQYHQDMLAQETAQFLASFSSLDNLLVNFIQDLPPVRPSDSSTLIVIHTLARVAVIQLHTPFINQNATAYTRVRVAARAIVQIIRVAGVERFQFIDPIFALLCATIYRALITCMSQAQMMDRNNFEADIVVISQAMEALASRFPIMDSELTKIRGS